MIVQQFSATVDDGQSLTFTMPSNFTAGNRALVMILAFVGLGGDVTGVTIEGTPAIERNVNVETSQSFIYVFESDGTLAGGSDQVEVTVAGTYYFLIAVIEIDDTPAGASIYDGAATVDVASVAATTTPDVTSNTLSQPYSLVLAGVVPVSGVVYSTFNQPVGWTALASEIDGLNHEPGMIAGLFVAGTTAVTAQWEIEISPGVGDFYIATIVAFEVNAPATPNYDPLFFGNPTLII